MTSDLRIHNSVDPAPSVYAARRTNGLVYNSPNISGMQASDNECDSLRISTWSAVASVSPNESTSAKNGSDHIRSGVEPTEGVSESSQVPSAARIAA